MRLLINLIMIMSLFVGASCAVKNADEKAASKMNNDKMSEQNMIDKGFVKGSIVESKIEGDCQFTIQAENLDAYRLDPEILDAKFMKHGEKVWLTYIPLRKAPRCTNANRIQIQKIMKREK